MATNESYRPVDVNIAKIAAMIPRLIAKDILKVQPMDAAAGHIFKLRPSYDLALTHDARPGPSKWFGGARSTRSLSHPFKYGDMCLDGDTYFFKIKLRGL